MLSQYGGVGRIFLTTAESVATGICVVGADCHSLARSRTILSNLDAAGTQTGLKLG